jgi:hypothetical protein
MKKIYLFLFTLLFAWQGYSQVINQNAAWPNSSWTVTGSYNTGSSAFEANPIAIEVDSYDLGFSYFEGDFPFYLVSVTFLGAGSSTNLGVG